MWIYLPDLITFNFSSPAPKVKFETELTYGSEVLTKELSDAAQPSEASCWYSFKRERKIFNPWTQWVGNSLRLYQQGINEPQDIKSNREQSILMSSRLMFTLNQFVWEDLLHVPVSDSSSMNHSGCCQRVTAFHISALHHLREWNPDYFVWHIQDYP